MFSPLSSGYFIVILNFSSRLFSSDILTQLNPLPVSFSAIVQRLSPLETVYDFASDSVLAPSPDAIFPDLSLK